VTLAQTFIFIKDKLCIKRDGFSKP